MSHDFHEKHSKKDHHKAHQAGDAGKQHPENGDEKISIARKEYEELQARLKELEEMRERLLRSAADFDNAKKRLMRERDEFVKFSLENLIRHLLPVLDNFERALSHARDDKEPSSKALISGIQMVHKQLDEILKNQGLVRLQTVGLQFDPHLHEAVSYGEEEGKADEILSEIEAGYTLNGKLLRAAKVRVRIAPSSRPEDSSASEEKQEEIT